MTKPKTIHVTEDQWRDGIKFLMGEGTNPTLTPSVQAKLRHCMFGPFANGMKPDQAAAMLRDVMGWVKR